MINVLSGTFERGPAVKNLGLALLGVGFAWFAEKQWKEEEEHFMSLHETFMRESTGPREVPRDLQDAWRKYCTRRGAVSDAVLVPILKHIRRFEVITYVLVEE